MITKKSRRLRSRLAKPDILEAALEVGDWRAAVKTATSIRFTDERKGVYLEVLARTDQITQAAKEAGVSYATITRHRDIDPDFVAAEAEAKLRYADSVKAMVQMRGVTGYDEPVVYQGEISKDSAGNPVTVKKYDSKMLELEAKRAVPEYSRGDNGGDVNVKVGVMVAPATVTPSQWISEQTEANQKRSAPPSIGSPAHTVEDAVVIDDGDAVEIDSENSE